MLKQSLKTVTRISALFSTAVVVWTAGLALLLCSAVTRASDEAASRTVGAADISPEAEVQSLRLQAEQGDIKAQRELGLLLLSKPEVRDVPAAISWLVKAGDAGDAKAQYKLFTYYASEADRFRRKADRKEALAWLRKAAEQGGVHANYIYASNYRKSDIATFADRMAGPRSMLLAAKGGHVQALEEIVAGKWPELSDSLFAYLAAATTGSDAQLTYLAARSKSFMDASTPFRYDPIAARVLARSAAERGNAWAMQMLTDIYPSKNGNKPNYAWAVYWHIKMLKSDIPDVFKKEGIGQVTPRVYDLLDSGIVTADSANLYGEASPKSQVQQTVNAGEKLYVLAVPAEGFVEVAHKESATVGYVPLSDVDIEFTANDTYVWNKPKKAREVEAQDESQPLASIRGGKRTSGSTAKKPRASSEKKQHVDGAATPLQEDSNEANQGQSPQETPTIAVTRTTTESAGLSDVREAMRRQNMAAWVKAGDILSGAGRPPPPERDPALKASYIYKN